MTQEDFLKHFVQNAALLMWFLGAGTSRSAGLPTATDICWDLKRRYYCLQENQDFQSHNISNNAIKAKIQSFMDSRGFPPLFDKTEYSFYFDLIFGDDFSAQQAYLREMLATEKISLTIGHRALAALLSMGSPKVVFTTNFDEVVECAYAQVTGKNLSTFHLEGSYAALDSLNSERFPIYAKLHGDFRYRSVKNLASDLIENDRKLQECFVAAASRYGLVVSGYSGRDMNVMAMLRKAIEQNNAFPRGLFWTTPRASELMDTVKETVAIARAKGIRASIVETGTFDELLSKMWRLLPSKPDELDHKVRTAKIKAVEIPLPSSGARFPVIRTNALPILKVPDKCGTIDYADAIDARDLRDRIFQHQPHAVIAHKDRLIFWGQEKELEKVLPKEKLGAPKEYIFLSPVGAISDSSIIKSFFEESLARALCNGKPLLLRRDKGRTFHAVVKHDAAQDTVFLKLRRALSRDGKPVPIAGKVPLLDNVFWAEAVSLRLENIGDGIMWLLIRPDIWISPLAQRMEAVGFLRQRKLGRYNNISYGVFDSWIDILLGKRVGSVEVSCFSDAEFGAYFEIGTRSGYSRRG